MDTSYVNKATDRRSQDYGQCDQRSNSDNKTEKNILCVLKHLL